jgi:formylglycine-generating enzyme required for sulfatase activity
LSTTQLAISQVAERVRAVVEPARKHVTRRRLAVAGVVIAIVLLLALVALRSAEGAEGRLPGNEVLVAPAPTNAPTVADAPLEPTSAPAAESTAIPLPEAPPGMVVVSGGTFKMGAAGGRFDPDETPPHWVTLNPFYLDAVEVTVAQFARFAEGSGYVTDAEKKGDPTTWRAQDAPDRKYFPVNRVSWNDAAAFCRWYGKRLPTEAEWELAAKGVSQNIYTWGNTFAGDRANTRERGVGQPIAVANLANLSPFGAYDMIGNVWEWTADWYAGDYYAVSPASNPTGPTSGLERVIRGGSFKSEGERATTTIRRKASQDGWADDIGFRCVTDVTE